MKQPPDSSHPNILFILTDQQSRAAMSAAGNRQLHTPHLDALAAGGVRFEHSYCTSPVCSPARASLLTGLLPHTHGLEVNGQVIRPAVTTMGDWFRAAGYNTAYTGKWHLPECYVQGDAMRGFQNLPVALEGDWWLGSEKDETVTDQAVAFLSQEHRQPFLLTVSLHNPHDICYWIMEQHRDRLAAFNRPGPLPTLPANFAINPDESEFMQHCRQRDTYGPENRWTVTWTEQEWREYLNVYYRLTEHADAQVGRVLATLREQGLEQNTLVVFTSDHGEGMAAHHWVVKLMLHEEPATVPFLLRWPGRIPAGIHDSRHLVSGADLFPTLCDYAGLPVPDGLHGQSLRPVIEQPWLAGREFVVTELQTDPKNLAVGGRMLRTTRYKYIAFSEGKHPEMLFDLEQDPGETRDLACHPDLTVELARHRYLLTCWLNESQDHFELPTISSTRKETPQ